MQRDLKVGLSLGVLVLGVVGALLFRREHVSETPQPTLKTARTIDERIAEGPRTPYMTGDVEFDQDDSELARPEAARTSGGRPSHAVQPSWLTDDEDPFQISKQDDGRFDFHDSANRVETAAVPLQPRAPATGHKAHAAADADLQTHVIQSGDSLSLIAERYLGSQGRYQEIFDANRDVLADVNRLPLGTTIVIPEATKTASKPTSGATARAAMGQPAKVRSNITDVSVFEPLAPPADDGASLDSRSTVGTDKHGAEKSGADVAPTVKVQEAKKFVTPSRFPFANQNHPKTTNPRLKPLDPEGEEFAPLKPSSAGDPAHDTTAEPRHYQVRKGDSLEKISTKIYGNAKRAADIFAANRKLLTSPNAVREGQELVLPE